MVNQFFVVVVVVAVGRKPLIMSQYQEILVDDKVTTINLDVGSNLTLVAGSRVKVICEADGVPEPSITWQQDGEEVLSSWNKTSLTIDNPGQVNLRTVSCAANNVLGIDTKASYLTILGKKLLQFSSLNIITKELHARTNLSLVPVYFKGVFLQGPRFESIWRNFSEWPFG